MSTFSQFHDSSLLDRTNQRERTHGPSPAPCTSDTAGMKTADSFISQTNSGGRVYAHDPFVYYKAFLDTNLSSAWSINDDGNTCHPISLSAQSSHYGEDHQQGRVRPVPYNVTTRFVNRSNGIPLSTIIEQGSYSTLQSHGSPPSVGRYPSVKVNDNISPNQYPHRALRSLDETTLRKIEEDTHQEQHICEGIHPHARPEDDRGIFDKECIGPTPIKLFNPDRQQSECFKTDDNVECKGLSRFLRGVLRNARASRQDGSRSSSMTNMPASNFRGERLDTKEESSRAQHGSSENSSSSEKRNGPQVVTISNSLPLSSSPLPQISPESEARNRTSLSINTDTEGSARYYPPIVHIPPAEFDFDAESRSSPLLLQPAQSSSSPSEHAPSTTLRDVTREGSSTETYTPSHRSRDDLSARYTFEDVPLYRTNAPALREYDRTRDASICNTISTTYSGTVLGIDLDLQQHYPYPSVARRSPLPGLFAPLQTSGSSIPRQRVGNSSTRLPLSITSSALPVLLPIAAASGIVRPNPTTPKLSFFSPSGNLIQAENSSSPVPSSIVPHYSNSSPRTVYNNILSNPVCEPPVRPVPVPMTTPPTSTAPLPAHLRHHHNYQHPAHSHIIPQTPKKSLEISTGGTNVKGCGGVVRTKSLQLHSEVKRPKGLEHSMLATGHKHSSSYTKSKFKVPSCVHCPLFQFQNGIAVGRVKGTDTGVGKKARKPHRSLPGTFSPLAGHVLGLCFSQPDLVADEADAAVHAGSKKCHKDRRIEREYDVLHTARDDTVQVPRVCVVDVGKNSRRYSSGTGM